MNKELSDKAWACLPKEFKEGVKKDYKICSEGCRVVSAGAEKCELRGCYRELEELFGHHNLTSDEEGEEMLCVKASTVREMYALNENILYLDSTHKGAILLKKKLTDLFGSKCLPEELNEDNFTRTESKPSEPKFKIGDKVRVKFNAKELHSNPDPLKKIYYWQTTRDKYLGKVFKITDIWKSGTITLNTAEVMFWEPFDLEPYTEPKDEGTRQEQYVPKNAKSGTHSFNHTLKDDFRDHNRLHIAAMAMQGILSNADRMKKYEYVATEPPCDELAVVVARNALRYADVLIAKCKKGGGNA